MNMVSLLIIALVLPYDSKAIGMLKGLGVDVAGKPADLFFWGAIIVSAVALIWAVWQSKHDTPEMANS